MARKSSNAVEIKGYGSNINIIVDDEADFAEIESELVKRLRKSDQFFSGLEIVLDLGDRILTLEECNKLKEILSVKFKLIISKVHSRANETRRIIEGLGWEFEDRRRRGKDDDKRELEKVIESENDTLLFKGTLRSGQKKMHQGNIVIVGDINPGAEVIATGDIVVMGTLRGVAHAGAEGNTYATIIALDLRPLQLRIAGCIGRSPDFGIEKGNAPEIAVIDDGKIVIRKLR